MNIIQSIYLTHFSKPIENRGIYQAVVRLKPNRILEFGIQRGIRTVNLLELSLRYSSAEEMEYICVDPFEDRTLEDGPGLSLRKTHKMLARFGIHNRLIPDRSENAVLSIARQFQNVDLMIIADPSLNWIPAMKDHLAGMMKKSGLIFLGTSLPNGQPFGLYPYTPEQFLHFNLSLRAA